LENAGEKKKESEENKRQENDENKSNEDMKVDGSGN
jgi:hypothetical protein